jgi:hypothetical protein
MKKQFNIRKSRIIRLLNRPLNYRVAQSKVFCIGLHKTGTTTLANYISNYGFKPNHSTDWANNSESLSNYDFFSDGGSHFDNQNEFNFEGLYYKYPNSKFILQTRDTEKWVISKLKHAGWNQNTKIEEDDISKITHADWKYKSKLTIQKFIEHKINYERKVLSFFKEKDADRLLVIDLTKPEIQEKEIAKFKKFLHLKSIKPIHLIHSNKRNSSIIIATEVHEYIRQVISSLPEN